MKKNIKKAFDILLNILEIYIPSIAFMSMFISFILQIFSRYILRHSFSWTYELSLLCFVWCVLLAACYSLRTDGHVVFSLIYDMLPPNLKHINNIIANTFIILIFGYSIIPITKYIFSISSDYTSILRISYTIAFFPFITFLILTIGRLIVNTINELKTLSGRNKELNKKEEGVQL